MLNYRRYPLFLWILFTVMGMALLSGCSLKSGPKSFDRPEKSYIREAPEASAVLAKAFEKTTREGQKFYFSGWAGTKIQKRSNGYYLIGSMDRQKGYSVDATIFGQPFRYYRWGKDVYVSEGEKWRKASPSEIPLEPFTDFVKLSFLTGKAVRDHDDTMFGQKCSKYVITLNADEVIKAARAMGVELSQDEEALSTPYLKQLRMKMSIWVGQEDNMIYKYMTQTNMPVPGAGSIFQEVSFKFWKYNHPGLKLPGPEKLKQYLIKEEKD
ncbi:MAG TPA: hypothetical protein VNT57_03940 [Desulfobacteria bacterium]|nr:hypothetical protein [Desulfobacteria bacterium]